MCDKFLFVIHVVQLHLLINLRLYFPPLCRLFGTLPKFVRGCDHVIKFFQCSETYGTKKDGKKNKGSFKRVEPSGKMKNKELETPHRIAETVREQSLGGMVEDKLKSTEDFDDGTRQLQQEAEESEKVCNLEVDENGNDVKLLNCGKV